jgi:hypothetical protein
MGAFSGIGGVEAMMKNLLEKIGFSPEVLQKYVSEFLALLQGMKNAQDKLSAENAEIRNQLLKVLEQLERIEHGGHGQR